MCHGTKAPSETGLGAPCMHMEKELPKFVYTFSQNILARFARNYMPFTTKGARTIDF